MEPLQITFAHLAICHYQNRQFLNQVQRQQGRIVLQKMPGTGLAKIAVPDNLVFSFCFQFRIPAMGGPYTDLEMLSLPRPLDHGRLCVDEEKLELSFRIDAPDPLLCVAVTQVYHGICNMERACTALGGELAPPVRWPWP